MLRINKLNNFKHKSVVLGRINELSNYGTENKLPPSQADVVVIGGGVSGCSALYQLSKRGVSAVLIERAKITSGTTWHTGGLFWRMGRPSDIDIKLLETSRQVFTSLEQETGQNSGWNPIGGLFLARTDERIQEYKRMHTFGHFFDVDTRLISPSEAAKLSGILDPKGFKAALYSPGDGSVDPTQLCSALIKGASNRGAQVFENCPITKILTEDSLIRNVKKVVGIETSQGLIKTNCIVNAAGVWARSVSQLAGLDVPVSAMKHSYVITQSIPEAKGSPNIRDLDGDIYFKIVGDTVHMGGYEVNPEIIKEMPEDFQFSLYELDKSCFLPHLENAKVVSPVFETVGIKSDICGPESFTPDHKPIMGEDPKLLGMYHSSGYNSAGMMFSGGCSEQLAKWITQGRPDLPMFGYDIRRFTPAQRRHKAYIIETSHESYVKNYDVIYAHEQKLAGRNFKIGVFHEVLVASGAVMEQVQGCERPGYFVKDRTAPVRGYDWFGYYDHVKNDDKRYEKELEGDCTFGFSKHHHLIGEESHAVRNNVGLIDLSSYTKVYLTGPDAQETADWLFTADTDKEPGKVVYTCSLNSKGGVEADVTVTQLVEGVGTLVGPILKGKGYYIVAGTLSGYHTISHFRKQILKKNLKAHITDISDRLGILSIQGPKSGELLQSITETPITDEHFPMGMTRLIKINGHFCRAMRISFVGELGYELHIPVASGIPVYNKIMEAGRGFDLAHVGFRALHSLSCEKGYHSWHSDLRMDDNPIEAGMARVCRKEGQYQGKQHVDNLKQSGCTKRRVFFTLQNEVPLYGLETIWRDDDIVGYLRRGDYGYSLDCSIGIGYVMHPKKKIVDDEFLRSGNYQIEVMDKKYPATLYLKSPFDPQNFRIQGQYDHQFQEQTHFED